MPSLLSLKDASARSGYSTKTLRNRIKSQDLRAVMKDTKYGATYFIPETELIRMMALEADRADSGFATPTSPPIHTVETPAENVVGDELAEPAQTVEAPNALADVLLRLTSRVEEQAHELGMMRALTERAHSLEANEATAREERDRLTTELAHAQAELEMLRRELAHKPERRRWFGSRDKGFQPSSTPPAEAVNR